MLVPFEEVIAEFEVSRTELTLWIEQRWILPVEDEGSYFFDEADRARVKLIAELRRDLDVPDDTMPVVLKLLDQVYSLRRTLNELKAAIAQLPPDVQAELEDHLREIEEQ